jgi:hypothetical protein
MTAEKLRSFLDGRRVYSATTLCLYCGARDAVLRKHICVDELELYCDWCEIWLGRRFLINELRAWMAQPRKLAPKLLELEA